EPAAIRRERDVRGGNLADQADPRRLRRLDGRQVLLLLDVAQAVDPAEQIELPRADAGLDGVQPRRDRVVLRVGDRARDRDAADRVDRRKQLSALDAVESARTLDRERGPAQIAAVRERLVDDLT